MYIKIKVSHLIMSIVLLASLLGASLALAGEPDSSNFPAATTSFSLADLYNRLTEGKAGTQRVFTEPSSGPGTGTMHTINEIMAVAPAPDNARGATRTQVAAGATYWGLRDDAWGLQTGTGTLASGNAIDSEVLAGVTYSNGSGASVGTMPNNSEVIITPGAANQTIVAGYHNGGGYVAGDPDLLATNIASGTNLFGVDGNLVRAHGEATDAQVLAGVTYSNDQGAGVGTMPNNGAGQTTVPTTTNRSIAAGYWTTANTVQGDSDLLATNIASGTNLFGVDGNLVRARGEATAAQVLAGVTYSNDQGAGVGTMPNNGMMIITPATITQTIATGYHNGNGYVAGDPDLAAANIPTGVNLFGVEGTLIITYNAGVPQTGQTTSYFSGDDGDLKRGVAWPIPRFITGTTGVVTDTLTGLIWLQNANCATTWVTRTVALAQVQELNTAGTMNGNICGDTSNGGSHQTDWRLPNVRELYSLTHYEFYNPAVPNTAGTGRWTEGDPFIGLVKYYYWSGTAVMDLSDDAWIVNLNYGSIIPGKTTAAAPPYQFFVLPVRGGQ